MVLATALNFCAAMALDTKNQGFARGHADMILGGAVGGICVHYASRALARLFPRSEIRTYNPDAVYLEERILKGLEDGERISRSLQDAREMAYYLATSPQVF